VRARARVCVCVCVRACVRVGVRVCARITDRDKDPRFVTPAVFRDSKPSLHV